MVGQWPVRWAWPVSLPSWVRPVDFIDVSKSVPVRAGRGEPPVSGCRGHRFVGSRSSIEGIDAPSAFVWRDNFFACWDPGQGSMAEKPTAAGSGSVCAATPAIAKQAGELRTVRNGVGCDWFRPCGGLDARTDASSALDLTFLRMREHGLLSPCSAGSGRPNPRVSCQTDRGTSEKSHRQRKSRGVRLLIQLAFAVLGQTPSG